MGRRPAPTEPNTWPEYVPNAKQILAHQAKARWVLFGGARGPGKSRWLLEHIKARMIRNPGFRVLLGRKDLSDLKKTTLAEWEQKVCEPQLYDRAWGGMHHKTDHYYRFPNGSTLYYSELKDAESWRSATLGLIAIDEAKEITDENVLRDLQGALRWTSGKGVCDRPECREAAKELDEPYIPHSTHPPYQIIMATNPAAGWLKDRFYTPYKLGKERPGHAFIPATIHDNPNLPADYKLSLIRDNPPWWVKVYVDGDWSSIENMAYPQFNRATHVWRGPIPFNRFRRVYGGIDYGSTGTEAHKSAMYLTAVLDTGERLTFWEWVKAGAPSSELFEQIRIMTSRYKVTMWYPDASQFMHNQELRAAGIPVTDAPHYPGAVKDGINTIDRLMTPGPTGKPGWYYTENCDWLPKMMEAYAVDPETGQAIKKADDEMDAVRYSITGSLNGLVLVAPGTQQWSVVKPAPKNERVSGFLQRARDEKRERMRRTIERMGI